MLSKTIKLLDVIIQDDDVIKNQVSFDFAEVDYGGENSHVDK